MTKMKVLYLGDLHTECTHECGAKIETAAPIDHMGKGDAFSPTDLFALSLGSCMVTVMAIHSRKFGVELKGMSAEVEKEMQTVGVRRIGKLIVRIRCPILPEAGVREKLEKTALECPVHLSIHPEIKVEVDFVWGI